jgi:hypothetical protein
MSTAPKTKSSEASLNAPPLCELAESRGSRLSEYHIPLTGEGCVQQLALGTPCEIPRQSLQRMLEYIDHRKAGSAVIKIEVEGDRAYLSPERITLRDRSANISNTRICK